jgi:type II secretion system protein C
MRNKRMWLLLSILISAVMLVEGRAVLSKPKITLAKNSLFEEELSKRITSGLRDNFGNDLNMAAIKEEKVETKDLELELLGTAISNIKDPIAFIKDLKLNKQGIYRLGSVIRDARVINIVMGEVVLDIKGKRQTLRLSKRGIAWAKHNENNPLIISASSGRVVVSRKGLIAEAGNILNTLPKLKIKPYYEADKVSGMMVEGIPKDSIIAAAGILNKDIVKTVNNQKIDSYQKALQVLTKVKNQPEIKVNLLREGQIKDLCYYIAN